MPLIPYANIEDLPNEAKAVFDRLPVKLNIFRMFANARSCFAPYVQFGTALLTRQKLDATLREIIILQVVHIEGGEYEWIQHVPIGLALGVTQAQIDAIAADRYDAQCFSDRDRAVMRLVVEVVDRVRAEEETVRKASTFLSPQEIVEAILTIGNYMMAARLTETTRTDLDRADAAKLLDLLRQRS
jgi:alkylhydroperoxidase family enzyme